MFSIPQNNEKTNNGIQQAAIGYIVQRGWNVIPIPYKSKAPVMAWKGMCVEAEDVMEYFQGNGNIGLKLGEPSEGIIDVDIDCRLCLRIADHFLPSTKAVFGRRSSQRSHRLYICSDIRIEKYSDPSEANEDRTGLVEIRGTGHQTVIPPSTHPSGERVEWHQDDEPTEVKKDILIKRVSTLAAAGLIARHWPKGSRNEAALALVGGLLRGGWNEKAVEKFLNAVTTAANDEEARERQKVIQATVEKLENDEEVTGWPRLAEISGKEVVDRVCEWLPLKKSNPEADGKKNKVSLATKIVRATEHLGEYFTDGRDRTFARLPVGDHREIWPINSTRFSRWLQKKGAEANNGDPPYPEAVNTAKRHLEAIAYFDNDSKELHNRVAEHDGAIWYDLSDERWRAIRVDTEGWQVVEDTPAIFRRAAHQKPQVEPVAGGDPWKIFEFVNVRHEQQKILVMVYVISCFIPDIAHPIPVIHGSQGAGKSFLLEFMSDIIDPSATPLLSVPREEKSLLQTLDHHYACYFDNQGTIPTWLSDILCRVVTGEGHEYRQLYTDDEAVIRSYRRCVGLSGINVVATRSDLLDRSFLVELEAIGADQRIEEKTLRREFREALPDILGGVLDTLSQALSIYPKTDLKTLPRMASFARYGYAIAEALGITGGAFVEAYGEDERTRAHEAVAAHPVGSAVIAFMEDKDKWQGSPSELLALLEEVAEKEKITMSTKLGWPGSPVWMSRRLNEVKPNLEKEGVIYEQTRNENTSVLSFYKSRENTYSTYIPTSEENEQCNGADPEHVGKMQVTVGKKNTYRDTYMSENADISVTKTDNVSNVGTVSKKRTPIKNLKIEELDLMSGEL